MIEPVHVIFCDDTRREDTGKIILIGWYTNGINFNSLPAQISLTTVLILRGALEDMAGQQVSVEIKLRSGTTIFETIAELPSELAEITRDQEGKSLAYLEFKPLLVSIQKADSLEVWLTTNDGRRSMCGQINLAAGLMPIQS